MNIIKRLENLKEDSHEDDTLCKVVDSYIAKLEKSDKDSIEFKRLILEALRFLEKPDEAIDLEDILKDLKE